MCPDLLDHFSMKLKRKKDNGEQKDAFEKEKQEAIEEKKKEDIEMALEKNQRVE